MVMFWLSAQSADDLESYAAKSAAKGRRQVVFKVPKKGKKAAQSRHFAQRLAEVFRQL
jgi:hypothetical protein